MSGYRMLGNRKRLLSDKIFIKGTIGFEKFTDDDFRILQVTEENIHEDVLRGRTTDVTGSRWR